MPEPQSLSGFSSLSLGTPRVPAKRRGRTGLLAPIGWAWGVSLALHILLFSLMYSLVFPYWSGAQTAPEIANAALVGDPDATTYSSAESKPFDSFVVSDSAEPMSLTPTRSSNTAGLLSGSGIGAGTDLAAVRPGGSGLDWDMIGLVGSGRTIGDSGYGLESSGGTAPEFFGVGGATKGVRNVVYVVDCSGSMVSTFELVRRELLRSVAMLQRSQRFHVIFFSSGEPLENSPRKLVNAIPVNKNKLAEFVQSVLPGGRTEPATALQRALGLEPDVIYFLTDGLFDDRLVNQLREWNRERSVKIFTIAFLGTEAANLLDTIAREHGGEFRIVTEDELP